MNYPNDPKQYIKDNYKLRRSDVIRLFEFHSTTNEDTKDFFDTYGNHEFYDTAEVLKWLGY